MLDASGTALGTSTFATCATSANLSVNILTVAALSALSSSASVMISYISLSFFTSTKPAFFRITTSA